MWIVDRGEQGRETMPLSHAAVASYARLVSVAIPLHARPPVLWAVAR